MSGGRPGVHADGYSWQQGLISNAGGRTLVDPNGHHVAHVYRTASHTYRAVTADGTVLAEAALTSGAAMAAVDNECRPCAWPAGPLCPRDREGRIEVLHRAHRDRKGETLMQDKPVTVVLASGRELTMTVTASDAVELADLAALAAAGEGTVAVVESESDGQQYTIRGDQVAVVVRPARQALWVLRLDVSSPFALRDDGLYDKDGAALHKPEWTREPDVAKQYAVSIYARSLASRAPAWMRELAEALKPLCIRHEIRNLDEAAPPSGADA